MGRLQSADTTTPEGPRRAAWQPRDGRGMMGPVPQPAAVSPSDRPVERPSDALPSAVTLLPPPAPTITAATDLGGVAVLKHGNLYLLSDAFGDIHPDSRGLGLYDLDTRVLSCAVLRVNGVRPTVLRGHVGNGAGRQCADAALPASHGFGLGRCHRRRDQQSRGLRRL